MGGGWRGLKASSMEGGWRGLKYLSAEYESE